MAQQQVVGRGDGVHIPGKVEVDILHGQHLGIAAPGGAALDAEHRPQGGLPQGDDGVLAQSVAMAWPRPTVVVVLPSPAGVGLMAVTSTSLPSGFPARRAKARSLILALYRPYSSSSSSWMPSSAAISAMGRSVVLCAISMSESIPRHLSGRITAIKIDLLERLYYKISGGISKERNKNLESPCAGML